MKTLKFSTCTIFIISQILATAFFLNAQPREQFVRVVVAPDHSDWQYKTGERVKFNISVLQFGNPLENVKLEYEIKPEKMEVLISDNIELKSGKITIDGGTLKKPGFLRCWAYVVVNGKKYTGLATAGFDIDQIKPTTELPDDFLEFWEGAKTAAAKIPLDVKTVLLPDRCTEKVDVFQVNIQNDNPGSRIYGILAVPKKEGKYPALLRVPGAGVRPYGGQIAVAEKGVITLEIGIHGIPVTMDQVVYGNLRPAALNGYWFYNLDDRDRYYYKRVYLGCIRSIDFLFSLPQFDGEKLAVTGGSQGGALTIMAAALDSRVKWLAAYYPALCDLTGLLYKPMQWKQPS